VVNMYLLYGASLRDCLAKQPCVEGAWFVDFDSTEVVGEVSHLSAGLAAGLCEVDGATAGYQSGVFENPYTCAREVFVYRVP
jgi:hypothetical protein